MRFLVHEDYQSVRGAQVFLAIATKREWISIVTSHPTEAWVKRAEAFVVHAHTEQLEVAPITRDNEYL